VQGACDVGMLPNQYPGYQHVSDDAVSEKFAKAWGVPELSKRVGFSLTDVPHVVHEGKLKAYYIFGEDPAQTEPDLETMRKAFAELEFIIVQDIFMTKTAMFADVILPATSCGSTRQPNPRATSSRTGRFSV
jgi:formate dehydrogenase major subunit